MPETFDLTLPMSLALGTFLGNAVHEQVLTHIFFTGALGAGKTTITRALVEALPNHEEAEVASPSFAVANYYPTTPPVMHCDLYRVQTDAPSEILDNLENPHIVTVLEWAEYLPKELWPKEVLLLGLTRTQELRSLNVSAQGPKTTRFLPNLLAALKQLEESASAPNTKRLTKHRL